MQSDTQKNRNIIFIVNTHLLSENDIQQLIKISPKISEELDQTSNSFKKIYVSDKIKSSVYRFKLDYETRILCRIEYVQNNIYIIFFKILYKHDYPASSYYDNIKDFLNEKIDNIITIANIDTEYCKYLFKDQTTYHANNPITNLASSSNSSKNNYDPDSTKADTVCIFDEDQERIISNHELPLFVSGPAGAGKSKVAFTIFLQKIKECDKEGGKFVYIAPSVFLINHLKSEFHKYKHENQLSDTCEVEITTYEDFIYKYLAYILPTQDPENTVGSPQLNKDGWELYNSWLSHIQSHHKYKEIIEKFEFRDKKQKLKLYQEFRIISGYDSEQDYLEKCGNKQTNFQTTVHGKISKDKKATTQETQDKKNLFQLYISFIEYCKIHNKYAFEFFDVFKFLKSKNISGYIPRYTLIVIDEILDFSNLQLKLLIVKLNSLNNIICCADQRQNTTNNMPTITFILSLIKFNVATLNRNYRCPPNIGLFTEIIELFRRKLTPPNITGHLHLTEYKPITTASTAKNNIFMIDPNNCDQDGLANLIHKLSKDVKVFLIVLDASYKTQCKLEFTGIAQIFTVEESKGLESDTIIINQPLEFGKSAFSLLEKKLGEILKDDDTIDDDVEFHGVKAANAIKKMIINKIDQQELFSPILSKIYVAASRATKQIIICQKNINRFPFIMKFFQLLGCKINYPTTKENLELITSDASTVEAWIEQKKVLELHNLDEQAKEIEKKISVTTPLDIIMALQKHLEQTTLTNQNLQSIENLLQNLSEILNNEHEYEYEYESLEYKNIVPILAKLLWLAIDKQFINVCEKLINLHKIMSISGKKEADIANFTNQDGNTALSIAISVENIIIIEKLLPLSSNTTDIINALTLIKQQIIESISFSINIQNNIKILFLMINKLLDDSENALKNIHLILQKKLLYNFYNTISGKEILTNKQKKEFKKILTKIVFLVVAKGEITDFEILNFFKEYENENNLMQAIMRDMHKQLHEISLNRRSFNTTLHVMLIHKLLDAIIKKEDFKLDKIKQPRALWKLLQDIPDDFSYSSINNQETIILKTILALIVNLSLQEYQKQHLIYQQIIKKIFSIEEDIGLFEIISTTPINYAIFFPLHSSIMKRNTTAINLIIKKIFDNVIKFKDISLLKNTFIHAFKLKYFNFIYEHIRQLLYSMVEEKNHETIKFLLDFLISENDYIITNFKQSFSENIISVVIEPFKLALEKKYEAIYFMFINYLLFQISNNVFENMFPQTIINQQYNHTSERFSSLLLEAINASLPKDQEQPLMEITYIKDITEKKEILLVLTMLIIQPLEHLPFINIAKHQETYFVELFNYVISASNNKHISINLVNKILKFINTEINKHLNVLESAMKLNQSDIVKALLQHKHINHEILPKHSDLKEKQCVPPIFTSSIKSKKS